MGEDSREKLLLRIQELEDRLEESEQLIEAIKAGEVDAFAINNNDTSEIYTLETGDYAYRILVEEFEEGAINITEEGLIVYTNPYFYRLLNLSYDSVIGTSFFELVEENSKSKFQELLKESLSGKSKGEIDLAVNDMIVRVYISLKSLQPKLPTVGIIVTDMTEKKAHETTILEYQKNLENKNVELQQSNTELASFAYIASHDLQEPLRKIQTFASRIVEIESENLSDNGKDHLNRMQNAAKRMQTLIEDLLTYSRTNTVERNFKHINLKQIIEEVKSDLREELQQKNAIVDADQTCEVNIIPFQFRQLLNNLISNSLKFSKPQESPHIIITSEAGNGIVFEDPRLDKEKKYCHISITDNGIGFDQQYSERIFELFQRLHGRSEFNGTGIGLAIVKKIIENHHGIITAKGKQNEGARFDIYIPA